MVRVVWSVRMVRVVVGKKRGGCSCPLCGGGSSRGWSDQLSVAGLPSQPKHPNLPSQYFSSKYSNSTWTHLLILSQSPTLSLKANHPNPRNAALPIRGQLPQNKSFKTSLPPPSKCSISKGLQPMATKSSFLCLKSYKGIHCQVLLFQKKRKVCSLDSVKMFLTPSLKFSEIHFFAIK